MGEMLRYIKKAEMLMTSVSTVLQKILFCSKQYVPSVSGGIIFVLPPSPLPQTDTLSQKHLSTFCSCSEKIIALSATVKMMNALENMEN